MDRYPLVLGAIAFGFGLVYAFALRNTQVLPQQHNLTVLALTAVSVAIVAVVGVIVNLLYKFLTSGG